MDEWMTLAQEAWTLPWVRAIAVALASVLAAKIADLLLAS